MYVFYFFLEVFLDICEEASEARIKSVTSKPKSKWRPVALDTIELEKLSVKKLRISAKDAMAVAEKLYTKGISLRKLLLGTCQVLIVCFARLVLQLLSIFKAIYHTLGLKPTSFPQN